MSHKKLFIFVDESGDFGEKKGKSDYYILSFVFCSNLSQINSLDIELKNRISKVQCDVSFIHTMPLIRRENPYMNLTPKERQFILLSLFAFSRKVGYEYKTFIVNRKTVVNSKNLYEKLFGMICNFIVSNDDYFNKYDEVEFYYDNGQERISTLLDEVCHTSFLNYKIVSKRQGENRMLQIADMICTFTLIELKLKDKKFCNSEKIMFSSPKLFKKLYLNSLKTKEFDK